MAGSFEYKSERQNGRDSLSLENQEEKRRQFFERAKLRESIKGKRKLLSTNELMKLEQHRREEMKRLGGRRGVLGKMIGLIPNVDGELLERERKEVSGELRREMEFIREELEIDLSSIEKLKEGINSGKLSEGDIQWAQQRIEEHEKSIQEEERRIIELKAELQKLSEQGEIPT